MQMPDDRYFYIVLCGGAALVVLLAVSLVVVWGLFTALQAQRARAKVAEMEADRLRSLLETIERVRDIRNATVARLIEEKVRR